MIEIEVGFTYEGAPCTARLHESDAARALAEVTRLLRAVRGKQPGPGKMPAMFGCCPSCGSMGVFEYAGAQPCESGQQDLQLWNCRRCNSTLSTRSIARASEKRAGHGA